LEKEGETEKGGAAKETVFTAGPRRARLGESRVECMGTQKKHSFIWVCSTKIVKGEKEKY